MSPQRLLLIDDDVAVAEVITDALAAEGYTIRHVSSPERALAALVSLDPCDLVLTDAFITQYSAPYVWLGQLRGHTAVPIIICSGWPTGTFADYHARGFAAVLAKPFNLDDLLALVATCGVPTPGVSATAAGGAVQV